jgi:hypothetical protein
MPFYELQFQQMTGKKIVESKRKCPEDLYNMAWFAV